MIEYPQAQRQIVEYPQAQRQMVPIQQSSTEDRLMLQRMEQQMGKSADILSQRRVEGSLPNQPLRNPKGKGPMLMIEGPSSSEPYDAAALRSGRDYQPQQQHQQQQQMFQPPPVQ
ncbi:unnamed protein product [Victoria cruziana]